MDVWEIRVPLLGRGQSISAPFGGVGDALRLLPTLVGGQSGSNRNHEGWGKVSLGLEHHKLAMQD